MLLLAIGQCISSARLLRSRSGPNGLFGWRVWGCREEQHSGTYMHGCLAPGRVPAVPAASISISSDIFAFSQDLNDMAGSDQAVGAGGRKSSPSQHVWHCLIYSGVYLFQFARHMAWLLKTSSALPAHHCIRQASRPQGCRPRAFFPSHGRRALLLEQIVQTGL